MKKNIIPIVFAANNGYSLFCYTAIYSLIKNASKKYFYHICIFQTNIEEKNCKLLETLSTENVKVECMDISKYTENITLKESIHLSIETYYRLFIPCILPQYEKILYLDSDMCILGDVSELYQIEIGSYPVGAAADERTYFLEQHSIEIGNLDYRKAFNAGVLLINTVEFEKQKIRTKCLELLAEDYKRKKRRFIFADQDALNVALYENYYILEKKWNYQPQYLGHIHEIVEEDKQRYIEEKEKALIMHFAGEKKPWKYAELPKAEVFWNYAKETPIFERMLSEIMAELRNLENERSFGIYQFPYEKIPFRSKIALYAAGAVGKSFYYQLKLSKYAELVLWVDKDWKNIDNSFQVSSIDLIDKVDFEYIIIAIENERVAEDIKKKLCEMNIPETKIVWSKYKDDYNNL